MNGRFEVGVLGATALFTAVLVLIAWWMGQHHDAFVQQVHQAQRVTVGVLPRMELPSFSFSEAPHSLPTMPPDSGFAADAGEPMQGTEAELAAILIPVLCAAWTANCGEYPSRFASEEERNAATTCEQDTLRDFRMWWRDHVDGPVVVVEEPHRARLLHELTSSSGGVVRDVLADLVRADAVDGEACASAVFCRDGSACTDRVCRRSRRLGEPCASDDWRTVDGCERQLRCARGRCEPDPQTVLRGFREGCVPAGTPCTQRLDCGDDCGEFSCVGPEAERHCVIAEDDETEWDYPGAPWNERTRCGDELWCNIGSGCWATQPDEYGAMTQFECLPLVGEGARCERARCDRRLRCVTRVPEGGICIALWCQDAHMLAPGR